MDIVVLGCVVFIMDRPGIGHGRREGIVPEETMVDVVLMARLLHKTSTLCVIYVFHVDVIPAFPPKWQPPDRSRDRAARAVCSTIP